MLQQVSSRRGDEQASETTDLDFEVPRTDENGNAMDAPVPWEKPVDWSYIDMPISMGELNCRTDAGNTATRKAAQDAFLNAGGVVTEDHETVRGKKIFRKKAQMWVRCTDKQLKQFSNTEGWWHFRKPDPPESVPAT